MWVPLHYAFVFAHQQQERRGVICTHSLQRTWAGTWCWCQRSLNPAGWSPWLQRQCRHGDRQQTEDRTAGWGVADRASKIKNECAPIEKDWERRREGCGCAPSVADVAAVWCWVCVFVSMHAPVRLCVCQRERKRERHSALPGLCVAILLAHNTHPLSDLLSQDSDTQMLVDASSQSS